MTEKESKLQASLGLIFIPLIYLFLLMLSPDKAFKTNIAECENMNDVSVILQGRLHSKNKKLNRSQKFISQVNAQYRIQPLPDPIYVFKSTNAHKGFETGNDWTKRYTRTTYVVREGEAPEGAIGKKALVCFTGSRPRLIKAIYIKG